MFKNFIKMFQQKPEAEYQQRNWDKLDALSERIQQLINDIFKVEESFKDEIEETHEMQRASAYNLMHYVALRNYDITNLQRALAYNGLSSLSRPESHVLANIRALSLHINSLYGEEKIKIRKPRVSFKRGKIILHESTERLLGEVPRDRYVRIMVTMPSIAADDYEFVKEIMQEGMNVARVNCAHDSPEVWERIINHVHQASRELHQPCKILMDLAGPKLRTSELEPGPNVLSWRPSRDKTGEITAPALIFLSPKDVLPPIDSDENGIIHMSENWISQIQKDDLIQFTDRRGKNRKLRVIKIADDGVWAVGRETCYIEPGVELRIVSDGNDMLAEIIEYLPSIEQPIILRVGDLLLINKHAKVGRKANINEEGEILEPALVGCPLSEVYRAVKKGETIKLDDGKIVGVVEEVTNEQINLRITEAKEKGSKLKAEKGINFPDSELDLSGLTEKDIEDLDFIAEHADIVSLSFVQEPEDVIMLQDELRKRQNPDMSIVLKIETQKGFINLTRLLLTAMRSKTVGIMIARGDLAVEYGWVRLAEIQEEILWLCEAAHIPVIWATQVLEGMAKKGLPSRAEITDAAMGQRAECVMLNKGAFITKAIRLLDDILQTMERNQNKKTALLRKLSMNEELLQDVDDL